MKILSAIIALSSSIACIISAPSVVSASSENLSQHNEQIIANSIQLLKLSTLMRLHQALPRSPWLGRRWCGYQLTNTTLTSTGALISGAGRFSYLHKNRIKHAPKDLFEHATWLRVAANADMVAGALTSPVITRGVSQWEKRHAIAEFLGDRPVAATPCVAVSTEPVPESLRHTLSVVGKILSQRDEMSCGGAVASHKKFVEQMALTSLTAGSKIENGIGGCVGAFAYTAKPQSRFRITGASNIAYGASYAVASAELIRNQFWNELLSAKAHKDGTAPEQVLSEQLKQLEMLETHTGVAATDTVH